MFIIAEWITNSGRWQVDYIQSSLSVIQLRLYSAVAFRCWCYPWLKCRKYDGLNRDWETFFIDGPQSKCRRLLELRERGKFKDIYKIRKQHRHKFIYYQNAWKGQQSLENVRNNINLILLSSMLWRYKKTTTDTKGDMLLAGRGWPDKMKRTHGLNN